MFTISAIVMCNNHSLTDHPRNRRCMKFFRISYLYKSETTFTALRNVALIQKLKIKEMNKYIKLKTKYVVSFKINSYVYETKQ